MKTSSHVKGIVIEYNNFTHSLGTYVIHVHVHLYMALINYKCGTLGGEPEQEVNMVMIIVSI